jgi:autotransporter-associated beta strand protein
MNSGILIEKSGTGTMFWNGPSTANAAPLGTINSPVTINAGTVVLQWNDFFINGDAIVNDGYLQFNAPGQMQTLAGVISGVGTNEVVAGTLTLTGNNSYGSTTYIASTGTLQIGAGGASGSPGQGNIDDDGTLVFDRSDDVTLTHSIYEDTGYAGSVIQDGSGTLTLAGATNDYTGATIVSNGTLVVNGAVGGDMDVSGGAVQPGAAGSVSALAVGGNMNISAGTAVVAVNKGMSPSNSLFRVTGNITYTDGTLKLVNDGPALAAGDTFTVFSQAVTGGAGITILSPGFTVTNNLASNGSVTVTATAPSAAEITVSESNGQVNLAWPPIWTGLHLQVQTDPVGGGINATNWVTIAGGDENNTYAASLSPTNNVFYRLAP